MPQPQRRLQRSRPSRRHAQVCVYWGTGACWGGVPDHAAVPTVRAFLAPADKQAYLKGLAAVMGRTGLIQVPHLGYGVNAAGVVAEMHRRKPSPQTAANIIWGAPQAPGATLHQYRFATSGAAAAFLAALDDGIGRQGYNLVPSPAFKPFADGDAALAALSAPASAALWRWCDEANEHAVPAAGIFVAPDGRFVGPGWHEGLPVLGPSPPPARRHPRRAA